MLMPILFLTTTILGETAVRGRVTYEGEVPIPQRLPVEVNSEVCGAKQPIVSEQLIVSRNFGVANTAVILLGVPESANELPAPEHPELNQENCVFSPHVQTVTAGNELVIGNSDPVIHNVHARLGENTVFNLGMPLRGVKLKRNVGGPGVVSLRCDSGHTWMEAYVVVVPHPFHTTTDRGGEFKIPNIPPGEYLLRTWHETLGVLDTPVEVKEGAGAEVQVTYRSPAAKKTKLDFALPKTAETVPVATAAVDPSVLSETARNTELATRRAARETDVTAGRPLYGRYCAACHGDTGDGLGEAAGELKTRPRDFRRGEYKFRSTKSGALPTEDDIFRTISAGIPGSDMPAWKNILSAAERRTLARYVTTFSVRFLYTPPPPPLVIPPETADGEASVARGKMIYLRLQCGQCHGSDGRAQGISKKMLDDWGEPIDATDLTRGIYKAGKRSEDLYRTLVTGLSGTPMPSFSDLITPDETWDLVHYLESLAKNNRLRDIFGVP
jgi:mono/diheme cytochrome c family protein